MRCSIDGCPGEYEHREVCTICGDVLFTPETVRRIESLRQTATPPLRTVPLYDFTQAKSA